MDVWEIDQRHGYYIGNIVPGHMKKNNEMEDIVKIFWMYNTVINLKL